MKAWIAPLLAALLMGSATAQPPGEPCPCCLLHDEVRRGLYVDCLTDWMNPGELPTFANALEALRSGRLAETRSLLAEAASEDTADNALLVRTSGFFAGVLHRVLEPCRTPLVVALR